MQCCKQIMLNINGQKITQLMMKNILIVTVGTRDIQVANQKELNFREPNFYLSENDKVPGYKLFKSPINAGASILKNKLTDLVEYPIIKPAIDFLVDQGKIISDLILICTKQVIDDQRFTNNDTFYFAEIIKQLIRKHYTIEQVINIHDLLVIEHDVNDYGEMYKFFNDELPNLITNQDNCNLYIFPQGGIAAISFGALLKSIELFPKTFHLYKSEASIKVEPSDFPNKFRTGIERQNILSLIENFYYHEVISSDPYVKILASYAQERLLFNYTGALDRLNSSNLATPLFEILRQRALDINNQYFRNESSYFRDYYISIKINILKKDFLAFVLKSYALCESFLKNEACNSLNLQDNRNETRISEAIQKNVSLMQFVRASVKSYTIKINILTYIAIIKHLEKDPKSEDPFIRKTLLLWELRNNIAHYLRNSAEEEIKKIFYNCDHLGRKDDAIDLYFEQGDKFWGVSGFGDYDIINDAIRTKLLNNKST